MKTSDQIAREIDLATKHALGIRGATKAILSERKAATTRIEFLRECLRITQILSADSIRKQYEKVMFKIGKYGVAIQAANGLYTKAQINAAIKDANDYYKPSQLNKQREVLEYINAD